MRKIAILIAFAAINASAIPAVAAECTSIKDIDASRARWEMVRSQRAKAAVRENTCGAYAVEVITGGCCGIYSIRHDGILFSF
jgi:hypothetical protein